jgi:hypothetical protein
MMGRKARAEKESKESAWIERVKRLTIAAMFSDKFLIDQFVLKGGNAIDLVYGVGTRASMDIDLSISGDFADTELEGIGRRIQRGLERVFRPEGLVPFDFELKSVPAAISTDLAGFWGGYRITFKLIQFDRFHRLSGDIKSLRRNALLVGTSSKIQVDISKFEYCELKEEHHLDGARIFVYTPAMLACEKLRAICQQTKEYSRIVKRDRRAAAPRARDFVDVEILMRRFGFDLAESKFWPLITAIFAAKRVPLSLLNKVKDYREFHRADFQAVKDAVKPGVKLDEFDDYFDDMVRLCERLEPLWNS